MARVWAVIALCVLAAAAAAQEATYIQIEAQPTLAEGIAAAESYDGAAGRVSGFRLGQSWYAIVLGPFERQDAEDRLSRLRFLGRIPRDAYLTRRADYGDRFYPAAGIGTAPTAQDRVADDGGARAGDESVAEARRGERTLSRQDRALLQTALTDAGFYAGAIDAAFGPATRQAMAAWQAARGFEATGVLTTAQRTALVREYRDVLEGLGMQRVTDAEAGIEIELPMDIVARAGQESPFVRYEPVGDMPVRVLLISQPGDAGDLAALYDVMQTLEVVPRDGPRTLRATSFDIGGRTDSFVSSTFARLADGTIKGFTLIWPTDDERRRLRTLEAMRASFRAVPGVLPEPEPAATAVPDLLSGLEVRRPERDRSGFFVDAAGTVLTTSEAVRACGRVTLDTDVEADVAMADESLGIALLRPRASLAPIRFAQFRTGTPRLQSEIAVAGYPYGGALSAPSLNFGTLADARGLDGSPATRRLDLLSEPGETGGPVLDDSGAVLGILVPRDEGARRLPEGVAFATAAAPITGFLEAAGLSPVPSDGDGEMAPQELTRLAADMTVLVRCWN